MYLCDLDKLFLQTDLKLDQMEVQDLREFIAEKFELHDRILEEQFKSIDKQFEANKDYQRENMESHKDLKDNIQRLQEDITKVKAMEAAAKERHAVKQELEKYKEDMKSKYSIMRFIEKYPKIIFTAIAVTIGLLFTGDLTGILKFFGL